jgi:hypothetical protein
MARFLFLLPKWFCSSLSTWQVVLLGEVRRRCLEKFNYVVGVKTITHLFEDAG